MSTLRRPRCECCDEVLEELLGMRQNFEKFFHRFNSQIVELRREVRTLISKPETEESRQAATNNASNSTAGIKRKAPAARSDSPWSRGGSDDSASPSHISRSSSRARPSEQKNVTKQTNYNSENTLTNIKSESTLKISGISSIAKNTAKRPVLNFFGIQLRVLPTCPFGSDVEFEQWESLLVSDEDQRDHLRVELMQGHFGDAEKYIKHIWSSVLGDNAAQCYSFRGNVKTDKKAVKDMTFTSIFKECFLQRYERHDSFFFGERTMRFFNYVHDRKRRISKVSQSSFENVQLGDEPTMDGDGERSIDGDSLMNEQHNDDEEDETGIQYTVLDLEENTNSENAEFQYVQPKLKGNSTETVTRYDPLRSIENTTSATMAEILKEIREVKRLCSSSVDLLPQLPLNTLEDFFSFDKNLQENTDIAVQLKNLFGKVGGEKTGSFIRAAVRKIITDEVANKLSWRGTIDKPSIQEFKAATIIREVCHSKFSSTDDSSINKAFQQHFVHAVDRLKQKTKLIKKQE